MADENTQNTDSQTTDAGNASQGESTSNDTSNQPQYATIDQLNRALTNYNKRLESKLQETLNSSLESLLGKLQGGEGNAETDNSQASQAKGSQDAQPNKDVLRLQKMVEDLNKKLQATEEAKESAARQALDERIKAEVLSTLTSLKVEKGEQVYRLVRDNIVIDESGRVKMKVVDPQLHFEDEKDLKSALTDWLNSEGSHFLPPRNVGGSGATNKGGVSANRIVNPADLMKMKPSELAKVDLKNVFGEDVLKQFFNTNS